jgi:tripeptide aminopeptidase
MEADFRIVTGYIEPHFMAGFSGGRKGLFPALVDLASIQRFHGFETLADPRADNGILDGNPCHEIALEIAEIVGVDFLFNVAITREREIAGIYCGDLIQAHLAGCNEVADWTTAVVPGPIDLLVTCGGGYPLDQTFYQTIKGMCTALPALGPDTTLLQISSCGEGVGSRAYTELMRAWGSDWRGFLGHIEANRHQTQLDQWEFQVQCRVLQRIGSERLWFATDGIPLEEQQHLGLTPILGEGDAVQRAQRAIDDYLSNHRGARVAVIPEGPYTMLRASSEEAPTHNEFWESAAVRAEHATGVRPGHASDGDSRQKRRRGRGGRLRRGPASRGRGPGVCGSSRRRAPAHAGRWKYRQSGAQAAGDQPRPATHALRAHGHGPHLSRLHADPSTGLGADDRAGVAVVLNTALEILERGLPHPRLTFCWFVQEEVGLHGSRQVKQSLLARPRLAFNWDGGSPYKLTIGATGCYRLRIEVEGLAAHAGVAPESGVSAIAIASLAIADLERGGWHGQIRKGKRLGTSNIGTILGGETTNVIADRVVMRAEARSHDPTFRRRIVREIERAFSRAARQFKSASGARGSVTVESQLDYESFRLTENELCVRIAEQAVRSLGQEPQRAIANGGIDANWTNRHGIPTVSLGCGQVAPHTVREALDVERFREACRIALRLATATES